MNISQIYIAVAIVALLLVAITVFFLRKDKTGKPLSTLAALAMVFIVAGIIFGENRIIGYGLIGIGLVLAVIDIINKYHSR